MNPQLLSVGLVDDHEVVRQGLALTLGRDPGLHVAWSAADTGQAQACALQCPVDLVVVDLYLHGHSAEELCAWFRSAQPATTVVIYTGRPNLAWLARLYERGVRAVLLKDELLDDLPARLRAARAGAPAIPSSLGGPLLQARQSLASLTEREVHVLRALAQGLGNKQLAAAIGDTEAACKALLSRVFRKIGVQSRTGAVQWARDLGLLEAP